MQVDFQGLHARDGLVDLERHRVHLDNFFPVGRFGAGLYVRTRDRFDMSEEGGPKTAQRRRSSARGR
jgi:hypothetical protein